MRPTLLLAVPLSITLTLATAHFAEAEAATSLRMTKSIERALISRGEAVPALDDRAVGTSGLMVHSTHSTAHLSVQLPGSAVRQPKLGSRMPSATAGTGYRTVVQETGEGSFRALIYLDSARAPREYEFDLGHSVRASLLPDGAVMVRDADGDLIGTMASPWAMDAAGHPVRTHYRLTGTKVVQLLEPSASTRYPVVADPWWIPVVILARVMLGMMTKHAAQQAAARGVSQGLVRQVIKNGKAIRGNGNTTTFSQGTGRNRLRVIVDNKSGRVITVTKG